MRADFSLRENKTIIRKVEELSNQPTSGQILITLKFAADYVIGNTFNIKLCVQIDFPFSFWLFSHIKKKIFGNFFRKFFSEKFFRKFFFEKF